MFGIPNLWLIIGLGAALLAGVAWHEHRISSYREEVLTQERARVALATELLQNEERKRNAGITKESEREAAQHELESAERERQAEEISAKVAELQKGVECVISRETVRAINRGR